MVAAGRHLTAKEIEQWVDEDRLLVKAAIEQIRTIEIGVVLRALESEDILRDGRSWETWACQDEDVDA